MLGPAPGLEPFQSPLNMSFDLSHAASGGIATPLHEGFVLLGPEGQVHEATPVACELLGASDPEDLRSRWNAIHAQLAPLLRGYADVAQSIDLCLDQGGRTRHVRCEVQPTEKVDSAGYRLIVRRSSEGATALESALLLASQYQILASLYATAAHDFRNSLNAISLSLDLLNRTLEIGTGGEEGGERQRRYLQSIRQEICALTASVGGVLEESRFDQAPTRCRLAEILESVVSLLRARAERQRVMMRLDASDHTIEVVGRPGELRLAMLNLASNALEAMPRGGDLALSLTRDGAVAVLAVSDSGPGIPEELRHLIWDLSFSTKGRQGLGLGLYVVRSVAHAHGGTVTLDPTDSGARFAIRLPFRQ
jgi:signal transduction histidine kinase